MRPKRRPTRWLLYLLMSRPRSIILASCKPGCKPGFRPGLQPGFRQVRAGLRHAFDFFCRKPGREHVEIDAAGSHAAGSLVRARARHVKKNPFRASQRTC